MAIKAAVISLLKVSKTVFLMLKTNGVRLNLIKVDANFLFSIKTIGYDL